MIQPKISVVTVCYNAVNDIEKTILFVINQTYPNVEYLIIDSGSTDGTMDVVNRYKKLDEFVNRLDDIAPNIEVVNYVKGDLDLQR